MGFLSNDCFVDSIDFNFILPYDIINLSITQMKLNEIIEANPGTLIKGFHAIRIEYIDGIKANITSPSFDGWFLQENRTKQAFGFNLIKDFKCEEELILVNRRVQSTEECLALLKNKDKLELNSEILEDSNWSVGKNSEIVRVTTEDTPGMLLGDFFTTTGDSAMPVPDNFFGKLYAKILVGDKMGWMCMSLLSDDCYLEIE